MSRYRNRRRRRGDHGVDDWLMTYADMITLLLCFFAIFLSVSVPKKEQFDAARAEVLEKFATAEQITGARQSTMDKTGQSYMDSPYDSLPSIMDTFHSGEGRSVGSGVDAGEGQSEGMGEGTQQGANAHEEEAPEGDRIKTLEMPSAAFFASGSSELKEDGKTLLQGVIDTQLNAAEYRGYQITIEGHTDDVPIHTLQFPSNWELSTARAAAVVRFLIERGVAPQRLRAAGYADIFPKVPNRDGAGNAIPANQAQNRRVVIKLEKIEKEK